MGIIKQGILGGLSGKVGTVVGASWKGIQYLRALPSSMSNPRTPAQQKTRMKLDLIVRFLKVCLNLIRIGFGGYAVKKSAFNAATSYNFRNAILGDYPALEVDFPNVLVSMGTLEPASEALAEALEPGQVDFSWADNSGLPNANESDTAMLLVYNPEKGTSVQTIEGDLRLVGSAVQDVPANWAGDTVHCYIAFKANSETESIPAKDRVSNSVYAGAVEIL